MSPISHISPIFLFLIIGAPAIATCALAYRRELAAPLARWRHEAESWTEAQAGRPRPQLLRDHSGRALYVRLPRGTMRRLNKKISRK